MVPGASALGAPKVLGGTARWPTVKDGLRPHFRNLRDALPAPLRQRASIAIAQHVSDLPWWQAARTVLLYASFASEVETAPLREAAWGAAKRVVLPRVQEGRLELHEFAGETVLAPSRWGIPEPPHDATTVPSADVELVVVPGLAFDRRGGRLGYGGAYYDRLLRAANHAHRIGVGFEVQVVDRLPTTHLDAPLDILVTENGVNAMPKREH